MRTLEAEPEHLVTSQAAPLNYHPWKKRIEYSSANFTLSAKPNPTNLKHDSPRNNIATSSACFTSARPLLHLPHLPSQNSICRALPTTPLGCCPTTAHATPPRGSGSVSSMERGTSMKRQMAVHHHHVSLILLASEVALNIRHVQRIRKYLQWHLGMAV